MPEIANTRNAERSRDAVIVRTSIIGIIANLLLAGFKAGVGLLSNSIAIVLDAVNNLSDALSSIITIIGTKLAGKTPDRNHPYGHGRIEYITTIIIAAIVLWAGITAMQESVARIYKEDLTPFEASFTKENIIRELDEQGVYTATYRLTDTGAPMYINTVSPVLMPFHCFQSISSVRSKAWTVS